MRIMDLKIGVHKARIYTVGTNEINGFRLGYVNGMNTSFSMAQENGKYLSSSFGNTKIISVYTPTNGIAHDFERSRLELGLGQLMPAAKLVMKCWEDYFAEQPNGKYVQFAHSEGAIIVRNCLRHVSQEMRDKIIVIAVAPGAFIHRELCHSVTHYVSKMDIVPTFDKSGRQACYGTTVYLDPHPNAKGWDHNFQSETYRKPMIVSFEDIRKKYCME